MDLLHNDQTARFLAKVKIDFDAKTKTALFSLPDFEVPKKKGEAIVDWDVIEARGLYPVTTMLRLMKSRALNLQTQWKCKEP